MKIDTSFYEKCIDTLEKAHQKLMEAEPDSIDYELYRSACVKEFEIILEQTGKLLRKILKPYFHSPLEVDRLYFKDLFRQAHHKGLLSSEACERWHQYRDNRNHTSHDYGKNFAENTLLILPQFILDSREISQKIKDLEDAD